MLGETDTVLGLREITVQQLLLSVYYGMLGNILSLSRPQRPHL